MLVHLPALRVEVTVERLEVLAMTALEQMYCCMCIGFLLLFLRPETLLKLLIVLLACQPQGMLIMLLTILHLLLELGHFTFAVAESNAQLFDEPVIRCLRLLKSRLPLLIQQFHTFGVLLTLLMQHGFELSLLMQGRL